MKYTEAMRQIQTSEAKKRAIAGQLYCEAAQEAQPHRSIIRHTRKPAAVIAAAAAAMLCIGTVTVGAATGWNYSALFDRYFSHRAETAVSYDFTGMGGDLNEVFETDDYIVTLDGYIADTYTVYFYYDVQLKNAETVGETEQRGERICSATHPVVVYREPGRFGKIFNCCSGSVLGKDADGTVHYVEGVMIPASESTEGTPVEIFCEAVISGFGGYDGSFEEIHTVTLNTVYPAEMHLLDTPVSLNVPEIGGETVLNHAAVSPIGIYLTTDTAQQAPAVFSAAGSFGATLFDRASVTVHHTNGSEEQQEVNHLVSMEGSYSGVLTENVSLLSFDQPIPLDDVDYVTVNGTVIPVH